ncbi:hypothetical protein FB451DRAFT_1459386 [Mycena latifolia]|nr:hypothetical protein FB451DRAFT_1459386 [Mycena latifolia]
MDAVYYPSRDALYNRLPISDARAEALPLGPPRPHPPTPPRVLPTPSYTTIDHPDVHAYLAHLDFVFQCGWNHYRAPSPTVFALAALAVFDWPADPAHPFFWAAEQRAPTAAIVQRVLDSGAYLVIPVPWTTPARALARLAEREARCAAAQLKRRAAQAGGAKGAELSQKTQRVTRAAARQAATASTTPPAPSDATATPSTAGDKKRRRSPLAEAPTPQRASARQQQQRAPPPTPEETIATETMPVPEVASVRAGQHARARATSQARSTSQESSETLVASSRAASVVSADTVVADLASSGGGGKKGKGRMIAPADEDVSAAPIASEAATVDSGVVTRSRATTKTARQTPYPATKDRQIAAGRGKAPTGRRKTAKTRK